MEYLFITNVYIGQSQGTSKNGLSISNTLKLRASNTDSGTENTTGNESAHEKFSGSASHSHYTIRIYNDDATKQVVYTTGSTYSESKYVAQRTNNQTSGIWGATNSATVSISGTCTGDHTHNMYLRGNVSLNNGDAETKPNNLTFKIWVRTA